MSLKATTDLMSLMQPDERWTRTQLDDECRKLLFFFKSQATDVAAEMKRKLKKKEKKLKKQKKLQQQANGDTNGEVSDPTVSPACVDLRCGPPPVAPSQCTACYSSMTPNHWLVPDRGLGH